MKVKHLTEFESGRLSPAPLTRCPIELSVLANIAAHINFMNNIKRFIIVFAKVLHKFTQISYNFISESRAQIYKNSYNFVAFAGYRRRTKGFCQGVNGSCNDWRSSTNEAKRETEKETGKALN